MPYTVGYARKGAADVLTFERATATEAWQEVVALEGRDEVVRYVKGPEGFEIGRGELQIQAVLEDRA